MAKRWRHGVISGVAAAAVAANEAAIEAAAPQYRRKRRSDVAIIEKRIYQRKKHRKN